jgi:hypothetical protein
LIDFISANHGEGYKIYSSRLLKQLQIYVRKRDKAGRDTNKTEAEDGSGNFDDLVIATALAFVGSTDGYVSDNSNLVPVSASSDLKMTGPVVLSDESRIEQQKQFIDKGGLSLLMPMVLAPEEIPEISIQRCIDEYTMQLGGIPVSNGGPIVTPPKSYYEKK